MESLFFNVITAYDNKMIYFSMKLKRKILLSLCHRFYLVIHKQHSFINFCNKNRMVLKNRLTL